MATLIKPKHTKPSKNSTNALLKSGRGRGYPVARPPHASEPATFPAMLASEKNDLVDVAIIGDLHLKADQMEPYHKAREQFQVLRFSGAWWRTAHRWHCTADKCHLHCQKRKLHFNQLQRRCVCRQYLSDHSTCSTSQPPHTGALGHSRKRTHTHIKFGSLLVCGVAGAGITVCWPSQCRQCALENVVPHRATHSLFIIEKDRTITRQHNRGTTKHNHACSCRHVKASTRRRTGDRLTCCT
jgi:hypothetical protein